MSDSTLERSLAYRLASVSDCWGNRRPIRTGKQHDVWFLDGAASQVPETSPEPPHPADHRHAQLARLRDSGVFTDVELRTIEALATERLTINDVAERDGCSRQAVLARILGNSKARAAS